MAQNPITVSAVSNSEPFNTGDPLQVNDEITLTFRMAPGAMPCMYKLL